ncbi:MAG: hypothetical protein FWE76_04395, partial [Symbiobacteriaceae bacterium]|nr:hypothetical protein [Symbiobacteriaceae bacterium]
MMRVFPLSEEESNSYSLFYDMHKPRARIQRLLDQVTRRKLVYVIAGTGYGKTQAVQYYVQQQPQSIVRWLHLTEVDNIGSFFWETLANCIAMDNPDMAEKLRDFGFPETQARFRQFAQIIRSYEHSSMKTFLVLDDFHL